jgi:hypothetical protein
MRWEKRGVIFKPENQYPWMAHHASLPIVHKVNDEVLRVYFGPRDGQGRTVTAFIEVAADDPHKVLYIHDRPVLSLGRLGTFDDSGVTPACLVRHEGKLYLLYIGWNRGVSVPYRLAIGLAVSRDGGLSFERVFDGPILDRNRLEPYLCTAPFAIIDQGKWKLWYVSGTGFVVVNGQPEPVYHICNAESADGYDWIRTAEPCLPYVFEGEAQGRPCVIKENGRYRMWYCFRGSVDYRTDKRQAYRLGYAESSNGRSWQRLDQLVGIDRSDAGWDSLMMAYPFVYENRGIKQMLYNGNGFGETGIGYAVLVEDDRAIC